MYFRTQAIFCGLLGGIFFSRIVSGILDNAKILFRVFTSMGQINHKIKCLTLLVRIIDDPYLERFIDVVVMCAIFYRKE